MSDRDGDSVSALHRVDLRGMRCPGPIVRLNTEFRQLATGTGRIGVKCWINKGEVMPEGFESSRTSDEAPMSDRPDRRGGRGDDRRGGRR